SRSGHPGAQLAAARRPRLRHLVLDGQGGRLDGGPLGSCPAALAAVANWRLLLGGAGSGAQRAAGGAHRPSLPVRRTGRAHGAALSGAPTTGPATSRQQLLPLGHGRRCGLLTRPHPRRREYGARPNSGGVDGEPVPGHPSPLPVASLFSSTTDPPQTAALAPRKPPTVSVDPPARCHCPPLPSRYRT